MASKLPMSLAAEYYSNLYKKIRLMEEQTNVFYKREILPLILKLQLEVKRESNLATNSRYSKNLSDELKRLLTKTQRQIAAELNTFYSQLDRIFNDSDSLEISIEFVEKVSASDKRTLNAEIKKIVGRKNLDKLKGIDLLEDEGIRNIINAAVNENVSLIKSIPEQYLQRVEKSIIEGLELGHSSSTIGKSISEAGKVTRDRGKFIARDQLGSVYSEVNQKRQSNLGIKKFKWLTSEDERVRESHRKLDGHVYTWAEGAQGPEVEDEVRGLTPGEDFNCRCTSTIVEDEIFEIFDIS